MEPIDKRYVIGIDLGTTNCAVAYADLQGEKDAGANIRLFKIPQLTGPGEVSRLQVLPSFLYLPGAFDLSSEAIQLPWGSSPGVADHPQFVGAFARDHGAKIPSRLVSSAKSWLCHPHADRKARILPWGAGSDVFRVSPIQATAAYLEHIKTAWNSFRGEDEDQYLENQLIILTVPASFDEVARELTVEAAAMAGLKTVTLLEEPLAAFYNWLIRHENRWSQFVSPDELILICDVGGGTTDFTLISLREVAGSPRFERIAVGDHLILGGDNMDLALARSIEMCLGKSKAILTGDRWKTLCHQCRQAKEMLLNGTAESRKITIMGEGSRLISGTLSADLDYGSVEQTLIEGFFPLLDAGEKPPAQPFRKGITEFGLPYEQEPAITRHLGWFLDQHQTEVSQFPGKTFRAPDCILFNGGALKPPVIQERIRQAIRRWYHQDDATLPRVLDNPDPDLAVALGAAYYGLVKMGRGVRVGSGSARSYYIGVSTGSAETDGASSRQAICLVERGLDEGSRIQLEDRDFQVLTNQPVSFDLYSSSFRSGDRSGHLVAVDDSLTRLPPTQTIIQYGKTGEHSNIPVAVEANYTEIGTLDLWCHSRISDHRWKLQFQIRGTGDTPDIGNPETFEAAQIEAIHASLRSAFSQPIGGSFLDALGKDISRIIDRPREKWPLSLIRSMADVLLSLIQARQTAPDFESRWLNLLGFCLRPGFGDGFDANRIKAIWKIYKQGPVYSHHSQVRSDWWILWRRISGGLSAGHQRQFFQDLTPILFSAKSGKQRILPQEYLEIQMAAASMERLAVKDKIRLGSLLLADLKSKKARPQQFWAFSRIGARELLYGPADRVIPPAQVSPWIEALISENGSNPGPAGQALLQLARKTGDRARDVDPALVERIQNRLSQQGFLPHQVRVLSEVVPLRKQETSAIFGEDLPSGLILGAP
ncbi:MAG: hsp70 family protein [Deltaproteobacteria bacterium]|nr:hsp70 family protein [Deltaproteobacteria bacterium]